MHPQKLSTIRTTASFQQSNIKSNPFESRHDPFRENGHVYFF